MDFAEQVLKAAQSDDLGEAVERSALVRMVQEEVETTLTRLEESRRLEKNVDLRGEVLGSLIEVTSAKREVEWRKILVQWTERQRQAMSSEGRAGRSRALQPNTASKASRPNKSSKGSGQRKTQPKAHSILSPVCPSRVSKAQRKESGPRRRKISTSCDAPQPDQTVTIDASKPRRSSERVSKLKDDVPATGLKMTSLRPIHSSRVSKATRKASRETQSAVLHSDNMQPPPTSDRHRIKRGRRLNQQSAPSAGPRLSQLPTPPNSPRRRSTRISRKPERFCPG